MAFHRGVAAASGETVAGLGSGAGTVLGEGASSQFCTFPACYVPLPGHGMKRNI